MTGTAGSRTPEDAGSFAAFMYRLLKANPSFLDSDRLVLTPAEFERHLRRAFEAGHKSGLEARSYFEQVFGKD